jgi:hypothetical protein
MRRNQSEEPSRTSCKTVSSEQRKPCENEGADLTDINARNLTVVTDSATSTHEVQSDDGGFHVEWTTMKRWSPEVIEEIGQDNVDSEVEELAKIFMKESDLYAHPKHKYGESDIYLWKPSDEYIKRNGHVLVRVYRCPMWYRFRCDAEIRIQEGPGGLILQRTGTHDAFSHTDPDDSGPIVRFICGRNLIPEHEIPEAAAIRIELGQPQSKIRHARSAVMQHRISSIHRGSLYHYDEPDESYELDADDHDENGPPELVSDDHDEERFSSNGRCAPSNARLQYDNHRGFARFCELEHDEAQLIDDLGDEPASEVHELKFILWIGVFLFLTFHIKSAISYA